MWGLNDVLTHSIAYGIGEEEGRAKAEREKKASSNWQTGTPTEKGDYLCVFQSVWAVEYYWCYWDGAWDIYFDDYDPYTYTFVAWQKINPPCKEKDK